MTTYQTEVKAGNDHFQLRCSKSCLQLPRPAPPQNKTSHPFTTVIVSRGFFFSLLHQCSVRKPSGISSSRGTNSVLIKTQSSDTTEIISARSSQESRSQPRNGNHLWTQGWPRSRREAG